MEVELAVSVYDFTYIQSHSAYHDVYSIYGVVLPPYKCRRLY